MELDDYLRLADDGCPHCPEHAYYFDPEPIDFECFAVVLPIAHEDLRKIAR